MSDDIIAIGQIQKILNDFTRELGKVVLHNGTNPISTETLHGVTSLNTVFGIQHTEVIHLDADNIAATTAFMLVDLSDTTNWPHTEIGEIYIHGYGVSVDPNNKFEGKVEIGFLTAVDGTDGDFNVIKSWHLDKNIESVEDGLMFMGKPIELALTHWFGNTSVDDILFQTDVDLQGPDGNIAYPSGDGDFVLKVTRVAGEIDMGIMFLYTTVA